ncbi:MAG: CoA-binding protein [Candidatus Heimdallarchaeaceae archaeon]
MANICEIPSENLDEEEIKEVLLIYRKIAVVGISRNPEKDAHKVPKYLMEHGYEIIPVNPFADKILGKKCYKKLGDVKEDVEIVDIFRPPEEVPEIVKDAIKIKAKVIWMQKGIVNNKAAEMAIKNGLKVVMDKCIMVEHKKLFHK